MSLLTSLLAPGDTSVPFFPPGSFTVTNGSPSLSATVGGVGGMTPAWLFDASIIENIGAIRLVTTAEAGTYDFDLWWTNAGAGSGNVGWRLDYNSFGSGETIGGDTAGTLTPTAAPAQNVVKVTTLLSGITVVASEILRLELIRIGSDAGDTLANDAAALGIACRKVS